MQFVMWTFLLQFLLALNIAADSDDSRLNGDLSYSKLVQLMSSLSSATGVSDDRLLFLVSPGGDRYTNPNVLRNPITQDKLFVLLQVLSNTVAHPLKEASLSNLITTSEGQDELKYLMQALKNKRKQNGSGNNDNNDSDSKTDDDVGLHSTARDDKIHDAYAKQQRNQGVLVPVGSNSGFIPLDNRRQQPVGNPLYGPQPVGSPRNRPIIVGSSAGDMDLPLQPIPTSIFDRLDSNRRQPIYIFTRVNPVTGGIISPNLIFRVNFTAGRAIQPYLLTYLSTGIAQPVLKTLLNILRENSGEMQRPTYLLSRVNETSGIPIPPYLVFNTDQLTGQPKAPYVLSRLDLQTGRPTQPEILQYIDQETGKYIVQEMLPLLNDYIAQGVKKK